MMLERGVQSNWAKKPGVNPTILWLTRPFRESFRIFPGKSMRTGASLGSRTPWHPAGSRRETSRIVQIHEPMPPQMPHRGREPHPPCTSQDAAGETCRNLRDVPMPPPHFQTMCWPSPTCIPGLVSRSSNPGMDPLPDSDGQVFVFHFPGVIQRVIRGVPNQIPERPSAGQFALGMERPNGSAIGVAVRAQALVGQLRTVRSAQPELRSPVLLRAKRMPDDAV